MNNYIEELLIESTKKDDMISVLSTTINIALKFLKRGEVEKAISLLESIKETAQIIGVDEEN